MADFKKFFPKLMHHEGGYVDDPKDKGGATKYGVTLAVWQKVGYDKNGDGVIDKEDVKLLTLDDAVVVAKPQYWDILNCDRIKNQSIAEFICDWGYNSGTKTAAKKVQDVLDLHQDGVIGPKTLDKINNTNQRELFEKLKKRREIFFRSIVQGNPSQTKFLKGWLIRNNSFKFEE